MLRLFALEMGVSVGEDKDAMVTLDDAEFSARVARQSRVANRMHIACAYALSKLEAHGYRDVSTCGHALGDQHGSFLGREYGHSLARARRGSAALEFRARKEAVLDQHLKERGE